MDFQHGNIGKGPADYLKMDGNPGKFIGSNLVIFCYKEFENSHCTNLLANRNLILLFILSQSKAVM